MFQIKLVNLGQDKLDAEQVLRSSKVNHQQKFLRKTNVSYYLKSWHMHSKRHIQVLMQVQSSINKISQAS